MTTPETRNALLPPDQRAEPVNLDELSAQDEALATEGPADLEPEPEPAAEPHAAPEPEAPADPELDEPADLAPAPEPQPAAEPEPDEPANFVTDDESDVDGGEVPVAGADLPDLTEDATLEAALEALLLVVDSPAEEELLATALELPIDRVAEVLRRMAAGYTEQTRGIDLRKVGGGWRFYTRDKFAPFVEKLLLDGQRARLTRAALETLAVIAYRQPVTRQRVAAVRGVNVDGVIRTLLARGLIEETGTDSETGGFLFRTTELFLERIGLSSLEDLPPIAPLLPEVDAIDDV